MPDTNVFLHAFSLFEGNGWPEAIGASGDVRLVVPLVVVRELDRQKRTNRRWNARRASRWLRANMSPDLNAYRRMTKDGRDRLTMVEVFTLLDAPGRPTDPDDQIIRFTQQLQRISSRPTLLATGDLSMQIRAAARGVDARPLLEDDDEN